MKYKQISTDLNILLKLIKKKKIIVIRGFKDGYDIIRNIQNPMHYDKERYGFECIEFYCTRKFRYNDADEEVVDMRYILESLNGRKILIL